ncbi:MAG: DUF4838 domain-containing protein [Planctomycetes bacterium]|nr:DUF4838 domain-containing protein [Planctomycetota bacterium]
MHCLRTLWCGLVVAVLAVPPTISVAAPIVLAENGTARVAIFVPKEIVDSPERVRARESVRDLAQYLERMTGTKIAMHTRPPQPAEVPVPILIGSLADAEVGPIGMTTEFRQGYRLVVSERAIGIQGETDEGLSYAIYEFLHDLGCRWIVPGDLGEVVPSRPIATFEARDARAVPGTATRNIIYADDAFKRRNRLGGFPYIAGHALESYLTKSQLEQNPTWNAEIKGVRKLHSCDVGFRICWANPEVSSAVADSLIERLNKNPVACISISPGDGVDFCECDRCKALDTGDWDPSMACVSITDRYVHFANRIAERVAERHPTVKLGFLAYVQFTRPPTREKLHPALIPQLAPITYCRAHTLDDPQCESRRRIRELLEGWGRVSRNVAMYEYYFHLAEVAAPFPAIARNLRELPVQYANGVTMWTPETMPNFESFTPGLYVGMRMAWNPRANPAEILQEMYRVFYGAAAGPMAEYWAHLDRCWTDSPEHAGCGFSYLARFTPQRMAEARRLMDAARNACRTTIESERVALADASLRQHELFMKLRRDFMAGRYAELDADSARWLRTHRELADRYEVNAAFTKTVWAPQTIAGLYFDAFFHPGYKDLARIGREFVIATPPIVEWRYAVDKDNQGNGGGWMLAEHPDQEWKTTNVAIETWSTLGLEAYYGPVWYRGRVRIGPLPSGKKVYVWVGGGDGGCRLYVNGQSAKSRDAQGNESEEPNGFCQPFSFEVTSLVHPDADNQLAIVGTRTGLNELGTGGLLAPVLIYHEK